MAYQVIARKYRPQRFSDVVGQEHVTQTLANAISQNRIAHAYLFVGPRGTGKTTIARIFAKALNATGGPTADFSEDDPRVREITDGRSMDVLEIDGASNRGIEEIRELRDTVRYAPATSKFKIYIIDEVHMLTKEAFNALLKTLEEPPAHVKFMFATTEPEKVLPTILSRCQRFDLRRIPALLIVKHLAHIAQLEQVSIDEPALHAIARGSEGCMRDAESTLDQLISFCGNRIVEEDVLSMFGLTARGQILSLADAILSGQAHETLREFNDLVRRGKDLARLLADLLGHFRNLLILQVSRGDTSLLDVPEAESIALAQQAGKAESGSVARIMDVLTDCESRLRDTPSKKILFEVGLLRAIEARRALPLDAVLDQLNQLRREGTAAPRPVPAPAPAAAAPPAASAPPPRPLPAPSSPLAVPQPSAPESPTVAAPTLAAPAPSGSIEHLWAAILEGVGRASPFMRTYLLEAHPVSFDRNVFTIGFDPEFADHLGLVDNTKNRTLLQTKLKELGHANAQVKFVQAERPGSWVPASVPPPDAAPEPRVSPSAAPATPPPAASAAKSRAPAPGALNKDDFKNDPLIRQALEIFKGQIVEVRA